MKNILTCCIVVNKPLGALGSFSFLEGFPLLFFAALSTAAAAFEAAVAAAAAAFDALFLLSSSAIARRILIMVLLGASDASDVFFCKDWLEADRFCGFWK
jgi:hypothetical protein